MTDNNIFLSSLIDDFRESRMAGKDSPAYLRMSGVADRARLAALAHSSVAYFVDPTDSPQPPGLSTIKRILLERYDNIHYRRGVPLSVSSVWPYDMNTPVLNSVSADYDDAYASPIIVKLGLRAWVFALANALVEAGFLVYADNDYRIAGINP